MSEQTPPAPIQAAFANALAAVGSAAKDGNNPHFKSRYITLDAIQDVVKPALLTQGLGYNQLVDYIPGEQCVAVTTMVWDSNGNNLNLGTTRLPVPKLTPQDAGSAFSYAKRYALGALFAIETAEDDDAEALMGRNSRTIDAPARPAPVVLKRAVTPPADAPDASWDKPVNGSYVFKGREWFMDKMSVNQLGAPAFASAGYPEEFKKMAHKELLKRVASGDNEAIDLVNQNSVP